MESHRLNLWKGDMKRLLKSMTTHKQDFAMHNRLDMLHKTLQNFVEHAFTLDLVMWRMSRAQFEGSPPSKQDDALDSEHTVLVGNALPHDACACRVNREIRYRPDIIVRDLILFLENKLIGPTARKSVQGCLLYHL